jgi:hypothetical protein
VPFLLKRPLTSTSSDETVRNKQDAKEQVPGDDCHPPESQNKENHPPPERKLKPAWLSMPKGVSGSEIGAVERHWCRNYRFLF